MPDREQAIKGLTEISEYARVKADIVGIGKGKEVFDSWYRAAEDAIAILREQEPKQMQLCNGELCCPQCGDICKSFYHYCTECGQAVKWDVGQGAGD